MSDSYNNLYGDGGHAAVIRSILGGTCSCYTDRHPPSNISGKWIVAIGDIESRKRIARVLKDKGATFTQCISKYAITDGTAVIGRGSVVMAGAVIETSVNIGNHVIVNTGATVNHHSSIGSFSHVAPGVTICGNVRIGHETLVGAGTTVINDISIGDNCIIGAGSVVIRDVPSNSIAYGNPCKIMGQRTTSA